MYPPPKKKKVLLLDFEPFLLRIVFGQLYYGFTFSLPDGLLSFLQSPFGLHLLKGVFYTSNNLFNLLLAMLASLLVPGSLRLQECWTRLQTLSLKRKGMQLLERGQNCYLSFTSDFSVKLKSVPTL